MASKWILLIILLSVSVLALDSSPNLDGDAEEIPVDESVAVDTGPPVEEHNVPSNETGAGGIPGLPGSYDPMTSNIAPQESHQKGYSGTPYTITEARLAEIRKIFMYPYYNKGGADNEGDYQKEIQASSPQMHKKLNFNAGNGTRSYEYKPYSQESVIRDLTGTGYANGFKGRHLFRIDENILLGSCNRDIDDANLPLMFAPESGNMLGGTVVNITGPCFNLDDEVKCKFDVAGIVNGYVVDRNRAICVQPPLTVEGYVRLEIAIGSNKWKGQYYVESPVTAAQKIYFTDTRYQERSPSEITITWEKQNLTTNDNVNIQISLWGYRETTNRPYFLYITDLADNILNTGKYTIIPSQYRTRTNEFLTDIKIGFIQINLTESIKVNTYTSTQQTVELTPVIWSRPIPLGWYFQFQWENMYGRNWPSYLCNDWLNTDRYLKNFAHDLLQCPCTVQQALEDKGKYLPDTDCDKDSNPQCYYNNQAIHCVKTGSPSLEGSEQQCCYDRNGYLMLSYDQQWGSSPRRCLNLGLMPYNEATNVSTLSQWVNDVVPKYLCCLWQDEQTVGYETLRFQRRPSQDCVAYQTSGVAGIYGDPHIMTFDDVEYTFNGKGEFDLVKSKTRTDSLEVQGRFEQMDDNVYGEIGASQFKPDSVNYKKLLNSLNNNY